MVTCLLNKLVQLWHKHCGNNQPLSDFIHGPLHEMDTLSNTAWVAKNLTLDESWEKPSIIVLQKEHSN